VVIWRLGPAWRWPCSARSVAAQIVVLQHIMDGPEAVAGDRGKSCGVQPTSAMRVIAVPRLKARVYQRQGFDLHFHDLRAWRSAVLLAARRGALLGRHVHARRLPASQHQ
jgi:hypothetical protein